MTILHVRYACGRTTSVECNLYFPVKIRLAKLPQKPKMSVTYDHFLQSHVDEFYEVHGGKQGIACLGFGSWIRWVGDYLFEVQKYAPKVACFWQNIAI